MTSPTFCLLATELVELIASSLNADDVLSLRLTCRNIQEKTFHFFCCRFFRCLQTDLSYSSLLRIHAVSKHRQFREYVEGMAFGLGKGVGREIAWERHPWGPLASPLQVDAVRMLRDSLLYDLVKCRSFFVVCRYPEGRPDLDRVTVSDAVGVLFAIVSDARLPVKSFHLMYSSGRRRSLSMDMRRLPLVHRQPAFSSAWTHLQELCLEQYLTLENFPFMLDLMLSAPNLRILSLTLSSHDLSAGFLHELASSDRFPQIQQLGLFRTSVQVSDLESLVRRLSKDLRAIRLHDISLVSGSWDSVFAELRSDFPVLTSFSFISLRRTPSCGTLTFSELEKKCPGQYNLQCSGDSSVPLGIEYSGSTVSDVLGLLQTTACIRDCNFCDE